MKQLVLDLAHRPRLGAEDFLVGAANREAVAWLARWPHWPAPGLVVVGPEGAGKSHLARLWAARAHARVVTPAEIGERRADALLADRRALVIEVVERPAADEPTLLHLYNLVAARGGHLLLTGRKGPAQWPLGLADLASRLRALPVVALRPPDDALLAALLSKLFADRGLPVAEEVIVYLLRRMERSYAAAGRLVAALDAAALAARSPITLGLARRLMTETADPQRQQGDP